MTVYDVDCETTVGVPLISPVELSKDRPAGRVGLIHQLSTGSSAAFGLTAVIGISFVKVNELGV